MHWFCLRNEGTHNLREVFCKDSCPRPNLSVFSENVWPVDSLSGPRNIPLLSGLGLCFPVSRYTWQSLLKSCGRGAEWVFTGVVYVSVDSTDCTPSSATSAHRHPHTPFFVWFGDLPQLPGRRNTSPSGFNVTVILWQEHAPLPSGWVVCYYSMVSKAYGVS